MSGDPAYWKKRYETLEAAYKVLNNEIMVETFVDTIRLHGTHAIEEDISLAQFAGEVAKVNRLQTMPLPEWVAIYIKWRNDQQGKDVLNGK